MYDLVKFMKSVVHSLRLRKQIRNFKSIATMGENFFTDLCAVIRNESNDPKRVTFGRDCRMLGRVFCNKSGSVEVGNFTTIAPNTSLFAANSICIGSFCSVAEGSVIVDNNNHPTEISERIKHRVRVAPSGPGYPNGGFGWEFSASSPVVIGDGVWVGANSTILKGVTIGEGAIVARSSVVTKDVEPYSIVAGNPAKIVKKLHDPGVPVTELADKMLREGIVFD